MWNQATVSAYNNFYYWYLLELLDLPNSFPLERLFKSQLSVIKEKVETSRAPDRLQSNPRLLEYESWDLPLCHNRCFRYKKLAPWLKSSAVRFRMSWPKSGTRCPRRPTTGRSGSTPWAPFVRWCWPEPWITTSSCSPWRRWSSHSLPASRIFDHR